jgi:integrase
MTPYATSTGELRLNWQRKDVGRITRVSGENTGRGLAQCHALLDDLYFYGHLDVLAGLRDGRISMRQLRWMEREKSLDLHDPHLGRGLLTKQPLWQTVLDTLPYMGTAEGTRKRYALSFQQLAERCAFLKDNAPLSALQAVEWHKLAAHWPGGAADWNRLRAAVSRLLTLSLGDVHHPLRREVMRKMPVKREASKESTLTVAGFEAVLAHLPEPLQPSILALALGGMRIGELYACRPEHLSATGEAVLLSIPTVTDADHRRKAVHPDAGTKTGGRIVAFDAAFLPVLQQAIPVPVRYRRLAEVFRQAVKQAGVTASLHDLRHLYGAEVTEAVGLGAAQKSMGHATASVTMRYAKRGELSRAATAIATRFGHLAR